MPYVHFWNYPLDILPLPGIKTIQPMIALYAEWMKMNAVVLNVNYVLTALSTGMNPNGFLVLHSYCVRSSHVLHMHCFMTIWSCLNKTDVVGLCINIALRCLHWTIVDVEKQ
jgi:hypothetical protein